MGRGETMKLAGEGSCKKEGIGSPVMWEDRHQITSAFICGSSKAMTWRFKGEPTFEKRGKQPGGR